MSAATGTSLSPTARHLWRRSRGLLLAAAVLALAGVAIAALRSGGQHGALDPRSPDPTGSRATAQLLAQHGVDTKVVTSAADAAAAAGPDTTLLVAAPDAVAKGHRKELRGAADRGARTVLLAPGPASTTALVPGVRAADSPGPVQPTPPDCAFPAAQRAGDVTLGGYGYDTSATSPDAGGNTPRKAADACYLREGLPTLLRVPAARPGSSGDTVLLGAPDPLHNEQLDKHGNASLALQLLGSRSHVAWYLPSPADSTADGGNRGLLSLLPDGWSWAALQLAVAAVLAALWRARRLGPLVPEGLPVSVRASEATEGRARLYRRARARGRAAEALRSATRTRLAPLVGLSRARAHDPDALVPAVTAHTGPAASLPAPSGAVPSGTTAGDDSSVHSLLFGAAPTDDAALIRLADSLDQLELRVTSTSPGPARTPQPTDDPPSTDKDRTP